MLFILLMIQYILANLLIGGSMVFGFFISYLLFIRQKRPIDLDYDSDKSDELHFDSFLEEIDNAPDSKLTNEQLNELKSKMVTLNLEPLLKQTVKMYYDHSKNSFMYYSEKDTIYKYLDIVARYYVLTYNCKELYVVLTDSTLKPFDSEETNLETINSAFMVSKKRTNKKILDKKFIHFTYKGNFMEYEMEELKKVETNVKPINIIDFLNMTKEKQN